MKRLTLAVCALFAAGLFFSACSKNPVGPSMSSMAISANATSSTGSTVCTTSSGNGGGATSVNTVQTNTVSTQSGDTGVSSVDASTGVNSAESSGSSNVQVQTSVTRTAVLHNHYTAYLDASTSGYFDFSAGRELPFTSLSAGDFVFKSSSAADATLGAADNGSGGIQLLSATSLSGISSVPTTGYSQNLVYNNTQLILNKCYAVKTKEGTFVAVQITGIVSGDPSPSISFSWKTVN